MNKDFFKHSWVINLDCRPERLIKAMKEFARIGINPERMPGLLFGNKYRERRKGCTMTHVKIWELCQEADIEMAIIFEDDVIIHPKFETLFPIVEKALGEKNWDMFLFDGHYNKEFPTPRTQEEIYFYRRTKHPHGTHAYAVKKSAFPLLIERIKSRPFADISINMGNVFKDIKVYMPNFKLATRGPNVSDIKGKKKMGNLDIAKDWYNLEQEDYKEIARSQLDEMISSRSKDSPMKNHKE